MIAQTLARMTVAEKAGLLLLAAVPGPSLDRDTAAMLRDTGVSGAVLLARNVESTPQLRALSAAIETACGRPSLPAIIASDEEGGRVQRLRDLAPPFSGAMAVGVVEFALDASSRAEEGSASPSPLLVAVRERFPAARGATVHAAYPMAAESAAATALARECVALVVGTRDAHLYPAQVAARDALLGAAAGKRVAVVSLRAPYDLAGVAGFTSVACIAIYGDEPAALAVAAAMLGE